MDAGPIVGPVPLTSSPCHRSMHVQAEDDMNPTRVLESKSGLAGHSPRIVFVTSNLPRRCGIATFSADLMAAVKASDARVRCRVAAIDEPIEVRPYGREVRWRIRQGDANNYRVAAEAINRSKVDIVNVQHEFGLYG